MKRILLALLAAVPLIVAPLHAQSRGVQLNVRYGLAGPSEDYDFECGDMSGALTVDVQGGGRLFPQLSVDHFSGSGMGGDDLCLRLLPPGTSYMSGVRLDGATRVGLGGGARIGNRWVLVEGTGSAGFIWARPGFASDDARDDRRFSPHGGGDVTFVLFRFVVLSGGVHWTRLKLDVRPTDGSASYSNSEWSPMATMQFGVRIPLTR